MIKRKKLFEVLDEWIELKRVDLRPSTYSRYLLSIKNIKNNLPNKPIKKHTKKELQTFLNNLFLVDNLAKKTIEEDRKILCSVFNYALEEKYLKENLTVNLSIPKNAKTKNVEALTVQEQQTVEQACKHDRYGHIIMFYLYSGLRRE